MARARSWQVRFLGTGASGGTPGRGKSSRRESSVLASHLAGKLLIDATRDFAQQISRVDALDGVLLTHAHRDACGGIPALERWITSKAQRPVPVLAAPETLASLRRRYRRLDHCDLVEVTAGRRLRLAGWWIDVLVVPHARQRHVPTYAWRLRDDDVTVVYASDVARPTPALRRFVRGATLFVVDGATWGRRIFSHLRIDADLPELCTWPVDRIVLTQIGRSAPPHQQLVREVRRLCSRARPAYDGLVLRAGSVGTG
jgi:ribonuclease BN (tRNA processing enzyme)